MMRDPYKLCLAVVLGLVAIIAMSAPAAAKDVTACGSFSEADGSRYDIKANIVTAGSGTCLEFPQNSSVFLNGFVIVGPGLETNTIGIIVGSNSFIWGPGVVRGFGICVAAGDHVAAEEILMNQCRFGLFIGESYKVKEIRVHDCTPSAFDGVGIFAFQGGFMESNIVRACDYGVITRENNKIWNLVVTRALFTGLQVDAGNAVSRTVISHPRSTSTIGLQYFCGGPFDGCQDGSNSVSGHGPGLNIQTLGPVVTQSTDIATNTATNCNGTSVGLRNPATGLLTGC
jgi:hypothetical protein